MSTERKILEAAAGLLEAAGAEGMTTRAVCQAAGVTAPTLYHHFGDKDGLLRQLVMQGVAEFMSMKHANRQTDDALKDLRRGWDGWLAFAIERPKLFALMVEHARRDPTESDEAFAIMRATIARLGAAGRLKIDVEAAARAVWAASNGVLTLFLQGAATADVKATGKLLFEAVTAAIVA